jgi:LPXTG-motif cell wall-anchored protein
VDDQETSMRSYLKMLVATATLTGAVLCAAPAIAQPGDVPSSGDDRATAVAGNKVGKDCGTLFAGSHALAAGDLTFTVDGSNTYIDITAVKDGVEVVAVIVKGGPAYNVYEVADLGDLAWLDLHSPLVSSGKPAQISHWFACGVKDTTTTTETSTSTSTTDTTETTETTTETTTESSTPGESSSSEVPSSNSTAVTTTTTSAEIAPVAEDDDLASTGFNGGWLVLLGAVLLLGGGAALVLVRMRSARH